MLISRSFLSSLILLLLITIGFNNTSKAGELTTPEAFFGFQPGEDRKMFLYEPLIEYLDILQQESEKMKLVENGASPMGKPMYIAFVSSEENIANLDRLQEINRRLALDGEIPENERQELIDEGKVFVLVTLSMHSTEVAPSQAAPLMAYNLITGTDNDPKHLEDVVFMMVPNHNPDGMNMVVEHYNEYLDTPYEGSSMPGVYHKYVGHNINRDFVTLTQSDNRAVADIYNQDWFPHVLVEKHQMGSTGPRYFVPPNHDPIAQNIDELLWNWTWIFGSNMSNDMTAQGLKGISQHYLFDDYWPGSTQTSTWKNVISLLTEAASVQLASPIYIEPNELQVRGKGLSEYKKSINFPAPWPGGWWTFDDLITYELESVYSLVKTGANHKEDILSFRNEMCRKEINKGLTEPPYYYVLPEEQHDKGELIAMLELLDRHGVDLYRMDAGTLLENQQVNAGDFIIPLAQPFRAFIKEVMESQTFPVRKYTPGGEMIRPYDITSWSLPLHRGVKSMEINTYYDTDDLAYSQINPEDISDSPALPDEPLLLFNATNNESFKAAFMAMNAGADVYRNKETITHEGTVIPAGSFLVDHDANRNDQMETIIQNLNLSPVGLEENPDDMFAPLRMPSIALCETNFHDMDAGWTRYLFDTYEIPYEVLNPEDFKETDLHGQFDVIVFPDASKDRIKNGHYTRNGEVYIPFYNPEYIEGMGDEGWQNVIRFIEEGGHAISWAGSTELFMGLMPSVDEQEPFRFPVRDISSRLNGDGFYCPGSLLKITLKEDHPVTYGMQDDIGVFHRNGPVFATSIPDFGMKRRVIGHFPEEETLLLSGYAEETELLERQASIVWLERGSGSAVLFSFAPNFRGSTPVSNKLIFNSLLIQ
ncbi:MAG: M14 family zinc carboxypeptidase [Bacteroidales bacterium]